MDYTTLLVRQYAFVRASHKLSKALAEVTCEAGKVRGPSELGDTLLEFSESMDALASCYKKVEGEKQ